MDRRAESAVLHDRLKIGESIDRAKEGDERHRRDFPYSRDGSEQLGLARTCEPIVHIPVEWAGDLLTLLYRVDPPVHFGNAMGSYFAPTALLEPDPFLEGNPLLEQDRVGVVGDALRLLQTEDPVADEATQLAHLGRESVGL
jgi:hypothetical protein